MAARTPAQFFKGHAEARRIFMAVKKAAIRAGVTAKISKSQIAFSSRIGFAWVWRPSQYLKGETARLVLSVRLKRKDASRRWKEIVRPSKTGYMHHLELDAVRDVDSQVRGWLNKAWEEAV